MKDWHEWLIVGLILLIAALAVDLIEPGLKWLTVGILGPAGVGVLVGLLIALQEVEADGPAFMVAAVAAAIAYFPIHLACILTFFVTWIAVNATFEWFNENHEHTRPPVGAIPPQGEKAAGETHGGP